MTKAMIDTQKLEAIDRLKNIYGIKPGMTLYTILRNVSRSGMNRSISVVVRDDEGITDITYLVARVLDCKRNEDGGMKVSGCGMDMGFWVVYNLSAALYGHENQGGYALSQRWL